MEISSNTVSESKLKSYISFTKFRLSALVILSALSGYLFASGKNDLLEITYLIVGGLFVTAASNGSNQIWERDFDKLMKRTQSRPLPQNNMTLTESYIIVITLLTAGVAFFFILKIKKTKFCVGYFFFYFFF
ncbi:MAG: UbiA family prenyltransferase [Flavobacteriia bacterium]